MSNVVQKFFLTHLLLSFFALSVFANSQPNNSIEVSGLCEKKVTPDRGQITFALLELQKEPSLAAQKLSQRVEKLLESLKKLNLQDSHLHTTGINLNERKEYENNRYVSKGFEAKTNISLQTSEIEKLGKAFSVASSQNVDNVDSYSTYLSTAKFNIEYNNCLEEAVKNARQKAERLASAAGAQVGAVEQISETIQRSEPRPFASKVSLAADIGSASSLPVAVGNQDFNVSVYTRFKIK